MNDDDFEAELRRVKTKRMALIGGSVVAVVAVGLGAKFMFGPKLPPLPKDDVAEIEEAMPEILSEYPELTKAFGAEGLLILEKERLPQAFLDGYEGIGRAGPYAPTVCGAAVSEPDVLAPLTKACASASSLLAEGATGKSLIEDCGLDGEPIAASSAESADAMCVALGLATWAYLEQNRSETNLEAKLIRMAVTGR